MDYTLFFRRLCASALDPSADAEVASLFAGAGAFRDWAVGWRRRLAAEDTTAQVRASGMLRANPALIPRNHRIEEVIAAATLRDDFEPFETLVKALASPYEEQPEFAYLSQPPGREERVQATFCGT